MVGGRNAARASYCFYRGYVVVNISFRFMAPFTRVARYCLRATLSATIKDSAV